MVLHQTLNGLHQPLIQIEWFAPNVDLEQMVSTDFFSEMSGLHQTLI